MNDSDHAVDALLKEISKRDKRIEGLIVRVQELQRLLGERDEVIASMRIRYERTAQKRVSLAGQAFFADVAGATTAYYGISIEQLRGAIRTKTLARTRSIAYFLMRELHEFSYPEIARWFGRDHSTIMHGIQRTRERIESDPLFRRDVEAIRAMILNRGTEPKDDDSDDDEAGPVRETDEAGESEERQPGSVQSRPHECAAAQAD